MRGSPGGGEAPLPVRWGTERFLNTIEMPAARLFRREHAHVGGTNF
jgi:hypothetical protein